MKATIDTHTIENLLLSLQQEPSGNHEDSRIMREIALRMDDPRVFQSEELMKYSTKLYEQSIIIWDAFESVTNGMYNPELLGRLEAVEGSSPFLPWKNLVLAILAYYQGDRDNMLQFLEQIPVNSPPGRFRGILRYLEGVETPGLKNPGVEKLEKLLKQDRGFIQSAVQQLNDCLENNHEEAFFESVILLIRDIHPSYPQAAKRLILWSIQTAAIREFDITGYIGQTTVLFGRKESLRLTASALASVEPDISILFWLKYAIEKISLGEADTGELHALVSIISDAVRRLDEDKVFVTLRNNLEYTRSLQSLVLKLREEVLRHFPGSKGPLSSLFPSRHKMIQAYEWLRATAVTDTRITGGTKGPVQSVPAFAVAVSRKSPRRNGEKPPRTRASSCKQLELFS